MHVTLNTGLTQIQVVHSSRKWQTNVTICIYSNQLLVMNFLVSELWSGGLEGAFIGVYLCDSQHLFVSMCCASFCQYVLEETLVRDRSEFWQQ